MVSFTANLTFATILESVPWEFIPGLLDFHILDFVLIY
jgi:hypothetical protein